MISVFYLISCTFPIHDQFIFCLFCPIPTSMILNLLPYLELQHMISCLHSWNELLLWFSSFCHCFIKSCFTSPFPPHPAMISFNSVSSVPIWSKPPCHIASLPTQFHVQKVFPFPSSLHLLSVVCYKIHLSFLKNTTYKINLHVVAYHDHTLWSIIQIQLKHCLIAY